MFARLLRLLEAATGQLAVAIAPWIGHMVPVTRIHAVGVGLGGQLAQHDDGAAHL